MSHGPDTPHTPAIGALDFGAIAIGARAAFTELRADGSLRTVAVAND